MEPVFICPAFTATAISAIVVSSVSPERWDIMVAYPARLAVSTVLKVSVRVPIWFTFTNTAFATPSLIPFSRNFGLVTNRSSPTSCVVFPRALVNFFQPSQSDSAQPSSTDHIGYFDLSCDMYSTMPSESLTEESDFLKV